MPRGGPRPGSGRPKGSADRFFRGQKEKTKAMNEAEQYLRTNNMAIFQGDSLALLKTIYKNEDLPLNIRQNAAIAASPFENPKMSDARVMLIEARAQKMSEEERQRLIAEGDARLDALTEQFQQMTNERDAELQQLIDDGGVTVAAAAVIRSWWLTPEHPALPPPVAPVLHNVNDVTPEPPAAPPARPTPPPRIIAPKPKPPTGKPATSPTADTLPPWFGGPAAPTPATVILYTAPWQAFWVNGNYTADDNGEIAVSDPTTIEALLHAGCSAAPLSK